MAGLYAPLPTLRSHPRGGLRTDRGRRGWLLLHRSGLSPHTPCRSPGALTRVTAHRIAQPPKATFVTRLRPVRSPGRAARQLPDQSTILWVDSSSTGDSRLRGALPTADVAPLHKQKPFVNGKNKRPTRQPNSSVKKLGDCVQSHSGWKRDVGAPGSLRGSPPVRIRIQRSSSLIRPSLMSCTLSS